MSVPEIRKMLEEELVDKKQLLILEDWLGIGPSGDNKPDRKPRSFV